MIDQPAFDAVLLEWRRTDATFAQRAAHLNGTIAGGLTGSYRLDAFTVIDDETRVHREMKCAAQNPGNYSVQAN